ncbi:RNA methyltransferase [Aureimonas sp. Leaf454]|uniref:RNA methyltransferase n=1 Tax=Aureimonas sp. Leaf454 TaxID=1736381 RepID=UPI0007005BCD|nr:RNA methyltransferase [Aureimonas sp. Leaf454]KQT53252.1 RNA methyltransferase [Aureimonas sp. Leaf454]
MAGTNRSDINLAEGPAIILCEPQLGENIGMVARAMANFGLSDLRLVNPRDGWPSDRARAAASRADHVIDAARLYGTTAEAVADLTYVLATTARPRDSLKPVRGPEEAGAELRARLTAGQGAGILFGRERFGLNNDEIGLADEIVTFPVNPAFASLNIAQAVLLMSYEWMKSGGTGGPRFSAPEVAPADKEDLQHFLDHLEGMLDAAGYFHPPEKRPAMSQKVRTILTKTALSEGEVRTLRGMLRHLERQLDHAGRKR